MFNNSLITRLLRTTGVLISQLGMAAILTIWLAGTAFAAGIKIVPSAQKVTPGESFYADVVVDGIPSEGLGAVQFRLNVSAPGSTVATVSDTSASQPSDVSVSSPLMIGPATTNRSGIGDFFWNAKSSHGILVIDNEGLQNGSGLYTLGHTNGAALPSGSGAVARFQINAGKDVAAEKIMISLSDVVLLDGSTVYSLDSNTGATVDLKCYTLVPNLIGMSKTDATTALAGAKLTLGTVYEIDNTAGTYTLNTVLVQSANVGTTILCDTPVDLAINTPPVEVGNARALDKAGDESGAVLLSWVPSSSSDTAGYRVYNASGIRITELANASSAGIEIPGLTAGLASQFRVTAYDTYGNESAGVSISATALDDVAPRISISGVLDGAYYASDIQPVITVQDANLATKELMLNGTAYNQVPVTLEGNYLLTALATDTAGNSTFKEIRFTLDKTAPLISVSGIAKGIYYNTDLSPVISVGDANLEKAETLLNGSAYTSGTVITAENNYELRVQAVDKAGNSSSDTYTFSIDKTKPTSTVSIGAPKFENGGVVYIAGVTPFTINGNDAGTVLSGVEKLEYRTNNSLWNGYQTSVTLAGLNDGPVTLDYRAVDKATNIEDFHTLAVILDATPPQTTLSTGDPKFTDASGMTYVTQNTVFTLAAADALSGVALTEYRVDSGAWTASAPFTVPSEGTHTILYRSKDNLGNSEADKTLTAMTDNTAPVTTITRGDPKYTSADGKLYAASAATFTLAAIDNLSGVGKTEYRIDSGTWTTYAPFTVAAEGTHIVDYRSQDNVGNLEAFKTLTIIVDNTPPVTTIATGDPKYSAADGKLYVTGSTTFTLAATDSLSGVAATEYHVDGGSWIIYAPFTIVAEGSHIIEYRSRDNVQNTETPKTQTVIVDNTPPVTTITTGDPKYTPVDGKLYVTSGSTFSLSASDNLSGVAKTEYRIDSGTWTIYAPFTVAAEGTHIVDYRSQDNAGNLETFKTLTVVVDNTPPVTVIASGDPKYTAADGKRYVTSGSTFSLSASDNLSGVATTEYRIDNGAWTSYAPFTIAAEGPHTIDYYSKDNVTNTEAFKTLIVIVDNTPPVTTITTGDPKYAAADGRLYVTSASRFTLAATDSLSGIATTEYRIDGGAWTAYAPFAIPAEGQHTIDYFSKDNVTNAEVFKSLIVIVDNTPPASTITAGAPQYQSDGKLYVSGGTQITIAASDAVSGVSKTEYSIDAGTWNTYAASFTLSTIADGSHTIRYRSTDNVGNVEAAKELAIILDKTPPETTISASDQLIDGVVNMISPSTFFTLTAADALSGVRSITYRINNGSWQSYSGSFNLAGMTAGQYTIGYKATDNVLNEETEKTITVRLITIQVEKKISTDSVVLVGFESNKSDFDQKQTDIRLLSSLLSSLNVIYTVAQNTDEFAAAMRSGRYNTYVLIDVKQPLIGQEIREAVNNGDGLIFIKTKPDADPFLDDVFGVKFSGRTTSDNLTVTLQASPISIETYLQTAGKSVVSTITSTTGLVFGSVPDKKDVYPAVIFNQYQQGRVLLYAFDLLNSPDQTLASALMVESLNYVRPQERTPRALDSIPLRITVRNSTEQVDVKLAETIPSGTTADTIVPKPVSVADTTFTWQKSLTANETARFGYYLNLPDTAGDYLTKTELTYSNNGFFRPYGQYELLLTVPNSSNDLLPKIITDLRNMQAKSVTDADLIAKAVEQLLLLKVNAGNRKEAEDNIRYVIQAIDEARKISSEVTVLRAELDELLKIWEKKWYLMDLP